MSKIVGFVNQKGGVGKTTLVVHIAAALAKLDKRVIVVDGDPQGNATSWLLDGNLEDDGLFKLLVTGASVVSVVRGNQRWGLGLIPGNGRTREAMIFLAATGKPFDTIASTLAPLRKLCDYVFLDMPPSRNAGFEEMLWACDYIVVPTQLERLPLEGVTLMAQTVAQMKAERGRGPRLLGVVPNMVRKGTKEHQAQMEDLVAGFGGVVWPPLPLSVRVTESASYGTTLWDLAPGEPATQAMQLIVDRFIENVEK